MNEQEKIDVLTGYYESFVPFRDASGIIAKYSDMPSIDNHFYWWLAEKGIIESEHKKKPFPRYMEEQWFCLMDTIIEKDPPVKTKWYYVTWKGVFALIDLARADKKPPAAA
jgi:hypothetical protein